MEWFVLAAPVQVRLDYSVGANAIFLAALLVALVPLFLAMRHALRQGEYLPESPRLRVIERRDDLERHAA